jgi:hypothetical protein
MPVAAAELLYERQAEAARGPDDEDGRLSLSFSKTKVSLNVGAADQAFRESLASCPVPEEG